MATNMKRYELGLHDFEALNMALDAAVRRARIIRDDTAAAFGMGDKTTLTVSERMERLERLRELFDAAHTGWLEIEDVASDQ